MRTNVCSHFLPQLVNLNKFDAGFKNCYILDTAENDVPFEFIYILTEKDSEYLKIHEDTVSCRDTSDGTIYKIKVNKRFHNDISLFYSGKYSKISEDGKRVMIENCGIKMENSLCYNVLYKTPLRKRFIESVIGEELPKDAEYMSILNLKTEVYDK